MCECGSLGSSSRFQCCVSKVNAKLSHFVWQESGSHPLKAFSWKGECSPSALRINKLEICDRVTFCLLLKKYPDAFVFSKPAGSTEESISKMQFAFK